MIATDNDPFKRDSQGFNADLEAITVLNRPATGEGDDAGWMYFDDIVLIQ